jgi:hypothetical protein
MNTQKQGDGKQTDSQCWEIMVPIWYNQFCGYCLSKTSIHFLLINIKFACFTNC